MPYRSFLLMCCFALTVLGQWGRSTFSIGAGGGFPTGGELTSTSQVPDSAAFSAAYEFRLFKYFAPEVGVVNLIPNVPENNDGYPLPPSRARVTLLSFGAHGILPLRQGRIELLAGAGGAHVWATDNYDFFYYNAPRTIWQLNGGARIALDKRRHFWIGPTVRFSRDGGRPTQEWASLTGDFGFRF
jgi:hypothetical protein